MSNDPHADFVSYDDIKDMFPIQPPPTRATILRWSRAKKFPAFIKVGIGYAEPLFNRQEVEAWLRRTYEPFFALKNITATKKKAAA